MAFLAVSVTNLASNAKTMRFRCGRTGFAADDTWARAGAFVPPLSEAPSRPRSAMPPATTGARELRFGTGDVSLDLAVGDGEVVGLSKECSRLSICMNLQCTKMMCSPLQCSEFVRAVSPAAAASGPGWNLMGSFSPRIG